LSARADLTQVQWHGRLRNVTARFRSTPPSSRNFRAIGAATVADLARGAHRGRALAQGRAPSVHEFHRWCESAGAWLLPLTFDGTTSNGRFRSHARDIGGPFAVEATLTLTPQWLPRRVFDRA
jgi:hypothetical protein